MSYWRLNRRKFHPAYLLCVTSILTPFFYHTCYLIFSRWAFSLSSTKIPLEIPDGIILSKVSIVILYLILSCLNYLIQLSHFTYLVKTIEYIAPCGSKICSRCPCIFREHIKKMHTFTNLVLLASATSVALSTPSALCAVWKIPVCSAPKLPPESYGVPLTADEDDRDTLAWGAVHYRGYTYSPQMLKFLEGHCSI